MTEKPTLLISLLQELITTTDKTEIKNLSTKIATESCRIKFYENNLSISSLILKKFCHLAVMEYFNSSQSLESIDHIEELIRCLETSKIFIL